MSNCFTNTKEGVENVKKSALLVIILAVMLCACESTVTEQTATKSQLSQEEKENMIYCSAQEEIIVQIEDAAASHWERYINVDDFVDVLRKYYGDEAEEIRDMTIYSGDLEIYTATDILNTVLGKTSFLP